MSMFEYLFWRFVSSRHEGTWGEEVVHPLVLTEPSVLPFPPVIQSQRITQRSISIINWPSSVRLFLLTNSYNFY